MVKQGWSIPKSLPSLQGSLDLRKQGLIGARSPAGLVLGQSLADRSCRSVWSTMQDSGEDQGDCGGSPEWEEDLGMQD
jgi:hypothetical protein